MIDLTSMQPAAHAIPSRSLTATVEEHFEHVWRTLRRLGVSATDADDGAQLVFLTAARRIVDLPCHKVGCLLSELAGQVAREILEQAAIQAHVVPLDPVDLADGDLLPDDAEELRRQRAWLQAIFDKLDEPLRVVLVLSELEEVPMREIAGMLSIPQGTVASRIRRARVAFRTEANRLRAELVRRNRLNAAPRHPR